MATFRFRIDGSPPSWNTSYRILHNPKTRRMYLGKSSEASEYQLYRASQAARKARPRDWELKRKVWVRVRYWMHLEHRMDPDNVLKVVNDGIAHGLDRNDEWFLPCVEQLTWGNKQPWIDIEIEELG